MLGAIGVYALVGSNDPDGGFPLFGFALARPSLVTGDTPAFPDPDAGLSAYVQMNPIPGDFTTGDFAEIPSVFTALVSAGDNYVIGHMTVQQAKWGSSSVNVRVYVDTDGWMVAYLSSADE